MLPYTACPVAFGADIPKTRLNATKQPKTKRFFITPLLIVPTEFSCATGLPPPVCRYFLKL